MSTVIDALIRDMLGFIGNGRPYAEVLDAWRTSCPRLTVWEDACDRGFVKRKNVTGNGMIVVATPAGKTFLRKHGRIPDVL